MSDASTRARLLLGPGDHDREIDGPDYLDADFEEGWRYELRNGSLSVMSPNGEEHDDALEPWRESLYAYKRTRRDVVEKIVPEAWVEIDGRNYRIGDLGVYLVGARSRQRRPARAPELMIEVLSPGTEDQDLIIKRSEYHRIGVLEYLIVDRLRSSLIVLTHALDGYSERILTGSQVYESPLLPGLAVPLSELS